MNLIQVTDAKGFITLHEPNEDGEAGDLVASVWRDDWLPRLLAQPIGTADTGSGDGVERDCTCHPDDRPSGPCRRKYAASECKADWLRDRRREALIERIGSIADLACEKPLAGDLGDVAYDLLRQAAAQISSDRLRIAALTSQPATTDTPKVPSEREAEAALNRINIHARVIDYPGGEIGLNRDLRLAFANRHRPVEVPADKPEDADAGLREALEPFAVIGRAIKAAARDSRWLEQVLFYAGTDTDPSSMSLTGRAFDRAAAALESRSHGEAGK